MNIDRSVILASALALLLFNASSTALPNQNPAKVGGAWTRYARERIDHPPAMRFPYQHCFTRAAAAHKLPESLLLAVARGESDFDPNARSHANAHGLMQILWPGTARHLGLYRLAELYDPCKNVDAGARYLKELMNRYDDDLHLSLAAYNYGPQRIPVNGTRIPNGAVWYSAYILRHLNYVLGDRLPAASPPGREYNSEGRVELAVFHEPYRAQAFVDALERLAPSLQLDWFRSDPTQFKVMLSYENKADFERSRTQLARAGFSF